MESIEYADLCARCSDIFAAPLNFEQEHTLFEGLTLLSPRLCHICSDLKRKIQLASTRHEDAGEGPLERGEVTWVIRNDWTLSLQIVFRDAVIGRSSSSVDYVVFADTGELQVVIEGSMSNYTQSTGDCHSLQLN